MNLQGNSESRNSGLTRGESTAFRECWREENKTEENGGGESGVWEEGGRKPLS
jgi:hypothetical protein